MDNHLKAQFASGIEIFNLKILEEPRDYGLLIKEGKKELP